MDKTSLPPLPDESRTASSLPNIPPIPTQASANEREEKTYKRVMRYTLSIALIVAAFLGVLMLYSFVHNVLMDDQNTVHTQDIVLDEYVINEAPADPRRSHVRMRPGAHPEAGYHADESVLIREREEDARFREQSGITEDNNTPAPRTDSKPREDKPAENDAVTTQPATESAPATSAPTEASSPATTSE